MAFRRYKMPSMHAAMILCAGLGTRLRPLTDWLAKPMVPVGDAPVVAHIASHLRSAGLERIVVNVHHRPADVRAWAARTGAHVSEESDLLGTAGGVAHARALLGEGDVLVWNGDILSELDPEPLLRAHRAAGAAATLAMVPRAAGEGNVGLASDGRIVRLRKERFAEERAGADFVGVHVVGHALRATLPAKGCLVGDVYLPALRSGAHLASHVIADAFTDVGSVEAYARANRAWRDRRGVRAWVAPDAIVSASVEGSIIGAGARIAAEAVDCIVWPGARVDIPIRNAVVTPFGTVPF